MSKLNYNTAEEFVRNIADIKGVVIHYEEGFFRIAQMPPPYYQGVEWWIVNEKGFFWEPLKGPEEGLAYLETEEAKAYEGLDKARESQG